MTLRTDHFDYVLPEELIAQQPAAQRAMSRLLVLDRAQDTITHDCFAAIGRYLRPGDLLVANRSRVLPARLVAHKATGGRVELLLLRPLANEQWIALVRPSRRMRPGMTLSVERSALCAHLEEALGEGQWQMRFSGPGDVAQQLRRAGSLPLPPYIHDSSAPPERYQTVYADREGSVAAPTAGLHFTPELLAELQREGIAMEMVTLHIGLGTFKPVTAQTLAEHHMHAEWGEVPERVAEAVNRTRSAGGRVVAVGTTTTRLLESAAQDGLVRPFRGETDRFIYPGYIFQVIDALVTNFHLPRSTLLMLVSALAGRERVLAAYEEAVRLRYRFYSFGDAMLIV